MVDRVIADYFASTTQHSAGKQVMTMRNSKAKSTGSSHSADDLSPDVLWCENCPEDAKRIVPANSESKNWNLCRQCWRDKGSLFLNAPSYKCSEEGCTKVSYKTRGMQYHLRICTSCYTKLREETLADIYTSSNEPADWVQNWRKRTLFLGNMPYRWKKADIVAWVWDNVFPDKNKNLFLFTVICEGDHGGFQGFALLEFLLARDAKFLLTTPVTVDSRRLVVRPAVLQL